MRIPEPTLLLDEGVRIPDGVIDFESFRRWSWSDEFPESGRIDFLDGQVVVDLAPRDIYRHGGPKCEIGVVLHHIVAHGDRGAVVIGGTRVASPEARLAVEPDVVVLLEESVAAGRVRDVEAVQGSGSYIELEGALDLIVEILSHSSEERDRHWLPPLYAKAGVRELWLVDAREEDLSFEIHALMPAGYRLQLADADGWVASRVLRLRFRLVESADPRGRPRYELEHRPP
jgi:Uma2 family endonuclease